LPKVRCAKIEPLLTHFQGPLLTMAATIGATVVAELDDCDSDEEAQMMEAGDMDSTSACHPRRCSQMPVAATTVLVMLCFAVVVGVTGARHLRSVVKSRSELAPQEAFAVVPGGVEVESFKDGHGRNGNYESLRGSGSPQLSEADVDARQRLRKQILPPPNMPTADSTSSTPPLNEEQLAMFDMIRSNIMPPANMPTADSITTLPPLTQDQLDALDMLRKNIMPPPSMPTADSTTSLPPLTKDQLDTFEMISNNIMQKRYGHSPARKPPLTQPLSNTLDTLGSRIMHPPPMPASTSGNKQDNTLGRV